ncbi:hypothetical protein GF351_02540 [Candidatus Woesearchaeota archaeon]|nr:hypothetical protein [Candidatus Woesearchaeota archaeon]
MIEIERSRLNREKGVIMLNKAMFVYFSFLFVAVIGFVNHYLSTLVLNALLILGFAALLLGAVPYTVVMIREEKKIKAMLDKFEKKNDQPGR